MAAKGPKPVPIEKRNAQGGTVRKGAISHRPAKKPLVLGQRISASNRPVAPAILPPKGKELWDEVIEILIDLNAATVLDVPNLTLMCIHWALAMVAYDGIIQEGSFDFGSTGQMRRSPLMAEFLEHSREFRRISEDFGLTTLGRTRLAMLDVTTRSIESDLNNRLGRNPRRTNRGDIETAVREIEK